METAEGRSLSGVMMGQPTDSKPCRDHLYLSAFILNLTYLISGIGFAWSSPVLVKLPLTASQGSTVASMLSLGMILGPFLSGALLDRIGRKGTVGVSMALMTVANLIMTFTNDMKILSIGRFLVGINCGIVFSCVPLFIAELSEDSVRGLLNTLSQFFVCLGSLIVYAVGPFASYSVLHYVILSICAVFLLLFPLIPNSPHYLVMKNDISNARTTLTWLRQSASQASTEKELRDIQNTIEQSKAEKGSMMDLFTSVSNRRAMLVCSPLIVMQQASGITVVFFFMETIMKMAGTSIPTSTCSIIIGVIMVASSCICPVAVMYCGYKKPLLVSALGQAIGMGGLGLYFLLKVKNYEIESLGWLPLLSIAVFIIFFNSGFCNIPWAMAGEMFPSAVKSKATMFVTILCAVFAFLLTNLFGDLSELLGLHVCFSACAVFCVISAVFVAVAVKDTSKMSFAEIQEMLSGRKRDNVDLGLEELREKTSE